MAIAAVSTLTFFLLIICFAAREEGVTGKSNSRRKWSRWRIWRTESWARSLSRLDFTDNYDLVYQKKIQVLDQEARARLNTIKLTKPEKGQQALPDKWGPSLTSQIQVEAMLCQMAQTGQLGGKMTESDLKNLLERWMLKNSHQFLNLSFISLRMSAGQAANKVKFDRRRAMDSDDDDDLEGL